mgnify:CR=1 FL=1
MASLEIRRAVVAGVFAFTLACAGEALAQETGIGKACTDAGDRPELALNVAQTSVQAGTRVALTASGKNSKGETIEFARS